MIDFMPHGTCFFWDRRILLLSFIGDGMVMTAYFFIPAILVFILKGRPKIFYTPILALFATFILLCGITHLMDIITVFIPCYFLQGYIKILTGIVSWISFFVLCWNVPKLLTVLMVLEKYRNELSEIFNL